MSSFPRNLASNYTNVCYDVTGQQHLMVNDKPECGTTTPIEDYDEGREYDLCLTCYPLPKPESQPEPSAAQQWLADYAKMSFTTKYTYKAFGMLNSAEPIIRALLAELHSLRYTSIRAAEQDYDKLLAERDALTTQRDVLEAENIALRALRAEWVEHYADLANSMYGYELTKYLSKFTSDERAELLSKVDDITAESIRYWSDKPDPREPKE